MDPGNRRGNCLEGAAVFRTRLGVPGFQLADPSLQVDLQDPFMVPLERVRHDRRGESSYCGSGAKTCGGRSGEEVSPRESMVDGLATDIPLHDSIPR